MAQPQSELLEPDALASLEDRILRTVELVTALRAERDGALAELAAAQATIEKLEVSKKTVAEAQSLRAEVAELRAERKQVRLRIEKLLTQMDQAGKQ